MNGKHFCWHRRFGEDDFNRIRSINHTNRRITWNDFDRMRMTETVICRRIKQSKNPMSEKQNAATVTHKNGYNRFLLLVARLGGLLYGVDVGIIAGALPYLEATFKDAATGQTLDSGELSFIVGAGLLGCGVFPFFAGISAGLL